MKNLLKKLPFYDSSWFNFFRFLVRHFLEDGCQQKAASLTYTTLLSIVPMITVLLMILSSVPALASAREQIYDLIFSNLMPQSSIQVSGYINTFAEKSSNLTAIGAMVLFVTTIMTLTTIERAFNQIWRVEDRSGGLKSILRYWTIVTLGPLVLGTAFIVSSAVQSLSFLNKEIGGYGIDWSFWVQVVSLSITVAGFIGMYWFIPKAKVPIKNAAIAGVFTAVTFELLKLTFGTVMSNFTSYEAIYGAFAALPIFLLWIYLSWNIILLGVEVSYTLTIFATGEVYPRHPLLSLLDMLNLVYTSHLKGDSVKEQELRDVLGRKELPKWYNYINYLKDSDLITTTESEEYVLKKNLNHMTLWDFYRTLPYPLPIKDELSEISKTNEHWLQTLAERFVHTERFAKQELDIPLAKIFETSSPRSKTQKNTQSSVTNDSLHNSNSTKASDEEAYDREATVVENNLNKQAFIPPSSDLESDSDLNKNACLDKSSKTAKQTSSGLFSFLGHHNKAVITEEDNPDK